MPPAKVTNATCMLCVGMKVDSIGRSAEGSQSCPTWWRFPSSSISRDAPGPISTSTASRLESAANSPTSAPTTETRNAAAIKRKLRRKQRGNSRVKNSATEAAPPRSGV